jgi:hypothetical protein
MLWCPGKCFCLNPTWLCSSVYLITRRRLEVSAAVWHRAAPSIGVQYVNMVHMTALRLCESSENKKNFSIYELTQKVRAGLFWVPRNLSDHMDRLAHTRDTLLVTSREMTGRSQTLPCWMRGDIKTTENKIHWPRWIETGALFLISLFLMVIFPNGQSS